MAKLQSTRRSLLSGAAVILAAAPAPPADRCAGGGHRSSPGEAASHAGGRLRETAAGRYPGLRNADALSAYGSMPSPEPSR